MPLSLPGQQELPEGRCKVHALQQAVTEMPVGQRQLLRCHHHHQVMVREWDQSEAGEVGLQVVK